MAMVALGVEGGGCKAWEVFGQAEGEVGLLCRTGKKKIRIAFSWDIELDRISYHLVRIL